jgi:hypothetical protein
MFRFTIRDVLWLTVVVALAFGWGTDRAMLARSKREAEQRARAASNAMDGAISQRDDAQQKYAQLLAQISKYGWSRRYNASGYPELLPPDDSSAQP